MAAMTAEQLEARKAELQAETKRLLNLAEQARLQAEMVNGMVQECDYWLTQLNSDEQEAESNEH